MWEEAHQRTRACQRPIRHPRLPSMSKGLTRTSQVGLFLVALSPEDEHVLRVWSPPSALLQLNTGLETLCRKLQSTGKLEHKLMKAVTAISHYQKHQQDLADNFVRLSNKYQDLKSNFHTVRAPRHRADFNLLVAEA
jgi:hypothetical protein